MSETDDFSFGQGSEQEAALFDQDNHKDKGIRKRTIAGFGVLLVSLGVMAGAYLEDEHDVLNRPTGDFLTDIEPQLESLRNKCEKEAEQLTDDEFNPVQGTPTLGLIEDSIRAYDEGDAFKLSAFNQCINAALTKVDITAVDGPNPYEPFRLVAVTD